MQTSLGLQGSWLAALWSDGGCNWNPISVLILREVSATELAPTLAVEDGDLDGTCLSLGRVCLLTVDRQGPLSYTYQSWWHIQAVSSATESEPLCCCGNGSAFT